MRGKKFTSLQIIIFKKYTLSVRVVLNKPRELCLFVSRIRTCCRLLTSSTSLMSWIKNILMLRSTGLYHFKYFMKRNPNLVTTLVLNLVTNLLFNRLFNLATNQLFNPATNLLINVVNNLLFKLATNH